MAQFKDFTQCQDDKLAITSLRRADFSLHAAIEHYYERLNSGDQVSRLLPFDSSLTGAFADLRPHRLCFEQQQCRKHLDPEE